MGNETHSNSITALLLDWNRGDARALVRLMPLIYEDLRRLARARLRFERDGHSLQTTGLVHETYLRLASQGRVEWRDRLHFFGAAANLMRRVLIDHARRRHTAKRAGEGLQAPLEQAFHVAARRADLLLLHDCLDRLTRLDPRRGRIVELRFFRGFSIQETADAEGLSPMTVKREWALARAWLLREMQQRV